MKRNFIAQKFLLILFLATVFSTSFAQSTPSFAMRFSDVENHWANSYIDTISLYGAVSGYTDGTFKPNAPIKRIEFIAAIVKALKLDVNTSDQNGYWGQPFIITALENRLIDPDAYTPMNIEQKISREEMASIVFKAYIHSGGKIDSLTVDAAKLKLNDYDTVSIEYYEEVVNAVALGIITGHTDGSFAPHEDATRAQAAVITFKLLVKLGLLSDADLPENILLSKYVLTQGELLKISVNHVDQASVVTVDQALYPNFQWVDTGTSLEGYIPTNYSTKPGVYSLQFTNTITGRTSTRKIEILERNFRIQRLTVDQTIESSTRNDEAYEEYRKYFNPARDISSPIKYYSEGFILPTRGKVTTEFGEARYVNGALTNYRHAGIDIAAPRNTGVVAANAGKVTRSMPLILTGNTIIIDHGEGLFSLYLHLEKLLVKEGDMVARGQLIGTVGSTGFSTGPHLHFTMSHYRFDIEPGYLIYGQSLTKLNYLDLMK